MGGVSASVGRGPGGQVPGRHDGRVGAARRTAAACRPCGHTAAARGHRRHPAGLIRQVDRAMFRVFWRARPNW